MNPDTLMEQAEKTGYLPFFHGTSASLSTKKGEGMTVAEAIAAAKLDFEVIKAPGGSMIELDGEEFFVSSEGDYNLVNTTPREDGSFITYKTGVTERFEVVQHESAFLFAADILDSAEAVIETVCSVKEGKKAFVVCRIPTSEVKLGGSAAEYVTPYLVLSNAHGGESVTGMVVPVRPACNNALPFLLKGAPNVFRIRHTPVSVRDKMTVQTGRDALELIAYPYMAEFERAMGKLLASKVSDRRFDALLDRFVPSSKTPTGKLRTDIEGKRQTIRSIYYNAGNLDNIRGTAYGFLNAVNEYAQHTVEGRNTRAVEEDTAEVDRVKAENRLQRILGGQTLDHAVCTYLLANAGR